MITCSNCGQQIPDVATFCPNCGCSVKYPIRPVTGQISDGMTTAPIPKHAPTYPVSAPNSPSVSTAPIQYTPTYSQPFYGVAVQNTAQMAIPAYTKVKGTCAGGVIAANIVIIFGLFLPLYSPDISNVNWLDYYDVLGSYGSEGSFNAGCFLLIASSISIFCAAMGKKIPVLISAIITFIYFQYLFHYIFSIYLVSYFYYGNYLLSLFGPGFWLVSSAEFISFICSIIFFNRLKKVQNSYMQLLSPLPPQQYR